MTTLVTYANPLQGTDSSFDFSTGNTYPAIAYPFGMNFWSPQTNGSNWFYQYRDHKFQGIRCSHQPSPWMGDYGHFLIMPVVGTISSSPTTWASGFRHSDEEAYPHYYRVLLRRYNIQIEVTPTERAVCFCFRFPTTEDAALIFKYFSAGRLTIDAENQRISGVVTDNNGGVPNNFACYFVAEVDTEFGDSGIFNDQTGGYIRLATIAELPVTMRVATSFISTEQAWRNLHRETNGKSFEALRQEAAQRWNDHFSRIEISGDSHAITFYSAFYRALLFPRMWYEYDESGNPVHCSPYDGNLHQGVLYADNGFWDTYRTVYPLLALLFPDRLQEIIEGWLNAYREGGWLPKWASPGYRDCMIGTHIDAVFADALVKGISGIDWQTAYEAVRQNATAIDITAGSYGRLGLKEYIEQGYVPCDRYISATSRTLDFAYNDFCVGQMARHLGHQDDAELFLKRAQNYHHVYDPQVGFMRGRRANGEWETPFSPTCWGGPFVEGAAWQHTWSVPHDIEGLMTLLGGKKATVAKLDHMLTMPPFYEIGTYPYEIHEMTEMAAVDFGQYAHSNQPVHHVLYLYSHAGASQKTHHWIQRVLTELYTADDLPGDEDNGEMSAWYLFSSLGFYPVCPGRPTYTLGCPLFEETRLYLPEDQSLAIIKKAVSDMQMVEYMVDDQPHNDVEIGHNDLRGTLTVKTPLGR